MNDKKLFKLKAPYKPAGDPVVEKLSTGQGAAT
jgi:hypothetical protein